MNQTVSSPAEPSPNITRLRQLAQLLDAAVRIPGTNIRFGLDPLLGLIPGMGDIAGGVLSTVIIVQAARFGAPSSLLARMVMNVAADSVVGAVPVLGDLFDVGWKSNIRNTELLQRYIERPVATRRATRLAMVGAVAAVLLIVIGAIALLAALVQWITTLAS